MKFRLSAPLILITAMTTAVVAFTGMAIGLSHAFGVAAQDEQFILMRRIVEDNFRSGERKALAQAEMIAALPAVKAAFAAKDRPRLLAETQEMFRIQNEKYGVDRAMFQAPNVTSFLRINTPNLFGDDLSGYRSIVVDVNHTPQQGLAGHREDCPACPGGQVLRRKRGDLPGDYRSAPDVNRSASPLPDRAEHRWL